MKTVLVLDYGFSGHLLGNEIEENLPVAVKRITVGSERDILGKTNWEIITEVEYVLIKYIGKIDAIVLANPTISMIAKEYLEVKYPNQIFIGYGWDLPELIKDTEKALIIISDRTARTEPYQRIKARCQTRQIEESDSQKWAEVIRSDQKIKDTDLCDEVERARSGKLVVFNSKILMMRKRIEERVGWKIEVTDLFGSIIETLRQKLDIITTEKVDQL